MRVLLRLLLLVTLIGGLPAPGAGQTAVGPAAEAAAETPASRFERWDAEAALIEQLLAEAVLDAGEVDAMRATLDSQRAEIPGLIARAEAELKPLTEQREALGPAPEDPSSETAEVANQRAMLSERIAAAEAQLKRLGQANARAQALLSRLSELRRRIFTQELLTRSPSIFEPGAVGRAMASIVRVVFEVVSEVVERLAASVVDARFFVRMLVPLVLIAGAVFLVLKVKRAAMSWLIPSGEAGKAAKRRSGVLIAPGVTLVRLLMPAVAVVMIAFAIWNSGLLGPKGEVLLGGVARAALFMIVAYALGASFYAPHLPEFRLSELPEADATAAYRWLMTLAAVVGLDLLLVVRGERLGLELESLELLNTLLLICGGIALWGYAGFLATSEREPDEPAMGEDAEPAGDDRAEAAIGPALVAGARIVTRITAVVTPALALLGYYAASRFLFYPLVLSGAAVGVCVLLFSRVRDAVDRFAGPVVAPGGPAAPSRVRLIPVVVGTLLTGALAPVLALIWGADTADLAATWRMISDGVEIGEVTIQPLDFFSFLLVFSIGFLLTRIVQQVLTRSVLPLTRMDAGGRAAIRAGVGYVGITLAALVAISTTRLDLSNLAIVAGALSVGIGFGLQNIVNNFVSGIILLIERPIKAGDWIQLGSGQGYVKRVNVRSTEIETFDRASLIVPNSELIAAPVINWTHTNLNGRIIVPVGVAYGSDPKKIEKILLEIAKAHPMLLRRPAPFVLFRRFGADALEFEIRGVLRDVNWILNVTSEINFEIARRFTEAGVEIPFAQRDLHLRNAGELGHSIGDALRSLRSGPLEADPTPTPAPAPAPRRRRRRPEAAGDDSDSDI